MVMPYTYVALMAAGLYRTRKVIRPAPTSRAG